MKKVISRLLLLVLFIASFMFVIFKTSSEALAELDLKKDIVYYDPASNTKEVFLNDLKIDNSLYKYIKIDKMFHDFVNSSFKKDTMIDREELKKELDNLGVEVDEDFYKITNTEKTILKAINDFKKDLKEVKEIISHSEVILIVMVASFVLAFAINFENLRWFNLQLIYQVIFLILLAGVSFFASKEFLFNGEVVATYMNTFLELFGNHMLKTLKILGEIAGVLIVIFLILTMLEKRFIKKKGIVTVDNIFDDYHEEEVVMKIKEQKQQERIERKLKERKKRKK